jgi:hypothetical protein
MPPCSTTYEARSITPVSGPAYDVTRNPKAEQRNWAAAGFWKELIAGRSTIKARECPSLNLAFWTWHDRVEDPHAAHTADELAEAFDMPGFDQEKFLAGAAEMLDGVKAFWDGLERDRLAGVRA